ncbi:MAG TPA: hypothetical protein VHC70_09205 [Phycisphaerales bacterium]|jgi:hypothetical protein|nr:hypothetical protein [Phycisphaerales bacterium]
MARSSQVRSGVVLGLVLGAAVFACLSAGGCYKRVVGARGLGAGAYDVSEPYQENSKVDDWLFGERPTHDKIVRPKPQEQ